MACLLVIATDSNAKSSVNFESLKKKKGKKKKSIDWTFSPPTPSTSKNYFFTADFLIPLCLESLKLPAFYSLWLAFWLSTAYMNDNFYTG